MTRQSTTANPPANPETPPELPAETPAENNEFDVLAALEAVEEIASDVISAAVDIPDHVKRFVESGYEQWKAQPRKWFVVNLGTAAEVKKIARAAKAHAQVTGRVFRVKTVAGTVQLKAGEVPSSQVLVYRVTDAPPVRTEPAPSETAIPDEKPA